MRNRETGVLYALRCSEKCEDSMGRLLLISFGHEEELASFSSA